MTPKHVTAARAWLGTRWRHRGRRPGVWLDCVGLVVCALEAAGRRVKDRLLYGREPEKDNLRAALIEEFGQPLPKAQAQVGDIALFRGVEYPLHVGIIGDYALGGLSVIHACNEPGARKVTENRLAEQWLDRLLEVYRPVIPGEGG